MIVHTPTRKLVLNVSEPGRVTTVIPTARQIELGGRRLVAVPHREDEVRVLRNMGFHAPAPVSHYYAWPGLFRPMAHQRTTAEVLTTNPRAFCLSGMGSGKTVSVLWAYDHLRAEGRVRRMLVLAPLSTLERTWGDEIFRHLTHLQFAVLHGSLERRLRLLATDRDVYITNHDGLRSRKFAEALAAREGLDLVVIDELAVFRNAQAERSKALRKLVDGREWVWGLTGTPTPNAPTDAWAQVRIVNPAMAPRTFTQFRDQVMSPAGPWGWRPRDNAADVVQAMMRPAVRFSREECIDLPPTTYSTRTVEMADEQKKAYKAMAAQLVAEYQGGQISAVNEGVKLSKLLQILTGTAYGADGAEIALPCAPRIDAVREIIEQADGKVIVFAPFTAAVERLAAELGREAQCAVIHGGVSKTQRDDIFSRFMQDDSLRVIVANPAAMSHGLTLTTANTIVWYGPTHSNEVYEQANARIVRPGQTRNTLIVHIEASATEQRIYARLQTKGRAQGLLLDLIRENSLADGV